MYIYIVVENAQQHKHNSLVPGNKFVDVALWKYTLVKSMDCKEKIDVNIELACK